MKPFLYNRLYAALLLELSSGHYAENSRFLSLREIASRFGASKPTANQVQRRMLEEGLLATRPRSGTFVAPGAQERAMLLLEQSPLSTIPAPRTGTAHRRRLLQKAGTTQFRHVAIIYHTQSSAVGTVPLATDNIPPTLRCSQGFLSAAWERNITVSFVLHDGTDARQSAIQEWLRHEKIGGVLLVQRGNTFRYFHEIVTPLLAAGLPVINAFGDIHGADIINVDFNNVAAAFQGAMRLMEGECPRLTIISSNMGVASVVLRTEGARLAALQRGVECRTIYAIIDKGQVLLPPCFERPGEAYLCLSYDLALALLEQAPPGWQVGRDYSCIAFSSIAETASGDCLDIMKMDFNSIGETAMHALVDELEGKEVHRAILLPMPYQPGSTVRPAPSRGEGGGAG